MSEYCTEEEFQEIVGIMEKFAELHPNAGVNFPADDVPVVMPASELFNNVKKKTDTGKAFLRVLRKIADQNNTSIVDVAKEGFRTSCGSDCGNRPECQGRHHH